MAQVELKEFPDYEYVEENPSSWRVWQAPEKPEWFEHELLKIAGKNRFGQPNLRLVWGGSCEDEHAEERGRLKYHCGYTLNAITGYSYTLDGQDVFTTNIDSIPETAIAIPSTEREELGLPRWIVEQWTSPEKLEQQKRFTVRKGEDDTENVLRAFPRQGVYDTYFIVENLEGLFRKLDHDLIQFTKNKWDYDKLSFEEQEIDREKYTKRKEQESRAKKEEIRQAAVNFDLKLPKDEKERRIIAEEAMRANKLMQEEEAKRLTFYQNKF